MLGRFLGIALLLALAGGFVLLAVLLFSSQSEELVPLVKEIRGPFLGAFFAFLFLRFADAATRLYDRQAKDHSALVRMEHGLFSSMRVLEDDYVLAKGFVDTLSEPVLDGSPRISVNELAPIPIEAELSLDMLNVDFISDLLRYNSQVRQLNDSMGIVSRMYSGALKSLNTGQIDLQQYKANALLARETMCQIQTRIGQVTKMTVEMIARAKLLGQTRKPLLAWLLHRLAPTSYPKGFEGKVALELSSMRKKKPSDSDGDASRHLVHEAESIK